MTTNYLFANPANYHIQLFGPPSQTLKEILGSMEIRTSTIAGNKYTEVTGVLPDQVALIGIIQKIHQLHYAITSIKLIDIDINLLN
ncbi:hypothetical protein OO013_08195 [Mangrovivirga sp. M17]|uniref:Uncharacterized protein n=1 Tax=Mangrovivirga halotolerans TaxID=2993936 RepID=A0ABT3RRE7_9BACT|nr:hypothetical protein [Mangrovivirga halotolerans]MCX2743842.1 hypothetical protein [Mangrovivirga halotolerans]